MAAKTESEARESCPACFYSDKEEGKVDSEDMRQQMETIRGELARNEAEHKALMDMLRGYEAWFRLNSRNGSQQLELKVNKNGGRRGKPLGAIGFRQGLLTVLREARGELLVDTEIWARMQTVGVQSNAKNPVGFISMHAGQARDVVEKVDSHTYRWIGKIDGRQSTSAAHERG